MKRLLSLLSHLTPSELRIAGFLVGWALLGAVAMALPWRASFSSDGAPRVVIPADDPRAALHAKSTALAAHLALARTPPSSPLDPNRASREELDRLPGVGPKTALRWVAARAAGGPFFALPDLKRIRGLGPVRLERIAPYLSFPGASSSVPRAPSPAGLNLNTANEIELAELPRVGPVLAARIVARRTRSGPLRSLADLDSVPGVGPAMLRDLSGRVRFE